MGLFLTRTYNHHWIGRGLFGQHWISNFDFSIKLTHGYAWVQYPDGRRIRFVIQPGGGRWLEDKVGAIAEITKVGTDLVLRNESGGVERYDQYGQILELKNRHGVAWHFAYTDKLLQSVTHSSGRQVKFFWSGMQVSRVVDPDGAEFHYTYKADAFGPTKGRLESVRLPGAPETTVSYLYEDSRFIGGLTGKAFNGQRYSRFAYDTRGRATLSEHEGGVERYTFEYNVKATEQAVSPPLPVPPGGYKQDDIWPGSGGCTWGANGRYCTFPTFSNSGTLSASSTGETLPTKAIASEFVVKEIGPLGRNALYTFESGRLTKTVGTGSCQQTNVVKRYDTRGYLQQVTNARGIDTAYIHDDKGRLLSTTEAILTPQERVTRFEWDPVTNLPKKELLVDVSSKDFTYTAEGRVASVAVTNLSGKGVAGERLVTNFNYTLS